MPLISKDGRTITYELLSRDRGLVCFSTLRQGGVSLGAFSSLNCGPYSGDDAACVGENLSRAFMSQNLNPSAVCIPRQVHQDRIAVVQSDFLEMAPEERRAFLDGYDAVMTRQRGLLLGISTADCIPVVLYDPVHGAIAAIHAGWRGTRLGITAKAVLRMRDEFGSDPRKMLALIGPGISLGAFEVGDEVYEAFLERGFEMARISTRNEATGKVHIDLKAAARLQLEQTGVPEGSIQDSGLCTYTLHGQFFSARRLGTRSGRILTAVMLPPSSCQGKGASGLFPDPF